MEVAAASMAASAGFGIMNKLQEGKDVQEIANARARIDIANAEATTRQTMEAAKIKAEQGRRLLASQKAQFAAAGVRVDVGSPLVVAAQTKADILKDIGFINAQGAARRDAYRNSASLERATGKKARRQSMWDAVTLGLQSGGSIAMLGEDAGWWGQGRSGNLNYMRN